MRLLHSCLAVSLFAVAVLCACTGPQDMCSDGETVLNPERLVYAKGEVVSAIDKSCWIVFQDKDNNYWLGSDGNGVCRFDGKVITRFTTKDGLAHDQVRGIQQHAASCDILITTNGGVSKFDGRRFVTLAIIEMKPPSPGDIAASSTSFASASPLNEGWVLNLHDLWLTGTGGPRRYDGTTLYQLTFPKSPHADDWFTKHPVTRWNPYDVWTVYTDRKGNVWFGTGGMGVCRFDGRSLDWLYEPHLTEVKGGGWFGFRSIFEDRHGDFWICNTQFRYKMQPHGTAGQRAGLLTYTREQGMDLAGSATTDKFIYYQSITEDNTRDLWMAPYAGGVWKYDGKSVSHFPVKHGDDEITMFSIFKDRRGDLWIGTHEHGAYKFNGKAFERFMP